MANTASINPNEGQQILRNIGRIKTLRDAIEKHTARGNADKVASLQEELDRRMGELNHIKGLLENL